MCLLEIIDETPDFCGKGRHHATLSCTLNEDVLASRHAGFRPVYTDGSVNMTAATASPSFYISSCLFIQPRRIEVNMCSTTAEVCGAGAVLEHLPVG